MQTLHTLNILLGRHERDRDAAMTEHMKLVASSRAAAAQAEELREYQRQYEQRWQAQFACQGGIELMHAYKSFTDRLDKAIEQQTRVAEMAADRVKQALTSLREIELRCASVERLIERRQAEQLLVAERVEQRQSDEAATRAAWNRLAATRPTPLL